MQAMEMGKKAGFFKKAYALTVTVAPTSEEHMLSEMRMVKQALVEWKTQRGKSAEMVMLTVVSSPDLHPFVKDLLAKTYEGEQDLSPLLKTLQARVALLNGAGKPQAEYVLGET
jgi:hypothetical protein